VTFEDISARVTALQTSTEAFSADSLFATLSATSSNSDLLTVSATDEAPRGIHKIKVLQTALAHRLGGTGVPDPIGTKLDTSFTITDFGASTFLSNVNLRETSDYEIDPAATSTFDYANNVELNGAYVGDSNVSMTIELLSDFGDGDGGAGTVDLRISFDGETFENHLGVPINADGDIVLTSDDHFGETGIGVTINAADANMKDGDEIMFRARAKASIEYTIADGSRKEIVIESDDTLSELVRAINDDSDLGLRGDILNDGSTTNPFRLILTSLTDGSEGKINILSNTSIIDLEGMSVEPPVSDSITYTGTVSTTPAGTDPARGLGNTTIVVEMIGDGALGDAKFRVSLDGGLTFHDNNGDGFSLTAGGGGFEFDLFDDLRDDNGDPVFDFDIGINLDFTDDGSEFSVGDRITIDLFDSEIQSAQDALINVNGINLVKSSNVVDDVFDGLTLNL
jgi:flagellar capping protein FliD